MFVINVTKYYIGKKKSTVLYLHKYFVILTETINLYERKYLHCLQFISKYCKASIFFFFYCASSLGRMSFKEGGIIYNETCIQWDLARLDCRGPEP